MPHVQFDKKEFLEAIDEPGYSLFIFYNFKYNFDILYPYKHLFR